MDLTHRYIRLRKSYLLRLVFVIAMLFGFINAQKTYMRSCDCEYTVDGKCAYTLVLPISNNENAQIGETCSKNTVDNKTLNQQLNRIESVENAVDRVKNNISELSHLTLKNAQFLIDLQSKVISLQHVVIQNESYWLDEKRTQPDDKTSAEANISEEKYKQLIDQLDRQQQQINSVMQNMNTVADKVETVRSSATTLADNINTAEGHIDRLGQSYEDANTKMNAQQVEIGKLKSAIDVYKHEGALCKRKGLRVSGATKFIPDIQMNVSSQFNENHGPNRARLFTTGSPGSWCPNEPNNDYEWLQFDLGTPKVIYGLVTRGRSDYEQWVTSYKIQTTDEWAADDDWTTYKDVVGYEMVFTGNSDKDTPVSHMLWQPIKARYIRFVPQTAYQDSNKCMRADVIGCIDNDL